MSPRGFVKSALTLGVGYTAVAGLFWALLSVPESNVLALTSSLALVVALVAAAGVTTGGAAAFGHDAAAREAARRSMAGLPGFVAGLLVFAALWWLTAGADTWWRAHRGEADALWLRYVGSSRTGPLHALVEWTLWLARWVLGPSIVAGLVSVGTLGGVRSTVKGLRTAFGLAPLAVAAAGALVISQGLQRLAYWRPKMLPPNWLEPTFAAVKLFAIYASLAVIGAAVLGVHGRAARNRGIT